MYWNPHCFYFLGTVPIKTRGDIVNDFNRKNKGAQVMLLSLAAGGVGLNLVRNINCSLDMPAFKKKHFLTLNLYSNKVGV